MKWFKRKNNKKDKNKAEVKSEPDKTKKKNYPKLAGYSILGLFMLGYLFGDDKPKTPPTVDNNTVEREESKPVEKPKDEIIKEEPKEEKEEPKTEKVEKPVEKKVDKPKVEPKEEIPKSEPKAAPPAPVPPKASEPKKSESKKEASAPKKEAPKPAPKEDPRPKEEKPPKKEEPKPQAPAKPEVSNVVYVTPSGKKYHKHNCPTIKQSKTIIEMSVSEALASKRDACKVCHK